MYTSDLKHPSPTLEQKLYHLYGLRRDTRISLGFSEPYRELLQQFGNPHLNLPPVIHVAGTNGKGSVIATLRAALEHANYRVHAYTSPHLMKFNERFVLAGQEIPDDMLEDLIDEALTLNSGREVTFFEITSAMGFAAFSRIKADAVLLEVGLGGRLDCSNIIENPLASVICTIGYDHTEFLGESLQQIAAEKAGIIKPGSPCIIAPQSEDALNAGVMEVFENKARETGSQLYRAGHEWEIAPEGPDKMRFIFDDQEAILPRPNLTGAHQINNAGTALAALKVAEAQFPNTSAGLETALTKIQWRGRLQPLEAQQFGLPPEWQLYLDGGHNENAGQVLAQQIQSWKKAGHRVHLVLGMLSHKDPQGFLAPMLPLIDSLTLTEIPGEPKSLKAGELAKMLQQKAPEMSASPNIQEALKSIQNSQKPGIVLIAGSIYLAGEVLRLCQNKAHNAS